MGSTSLHRGARASCERPFGPLSCCHRARLTWPLATATVLAIRTGRRGREHGRRRPKSSIEGRFPAVRASMNTTRPRGGGSDAVRGRRKDVLRVRASFRGKRLAALLTLLGCAALVPAAQAAVDFRG